MSEEPRPKTVKSRINLEEIIDKGREKIAKLTGLKPVAVVEVNPVDQDRWSLKVELLEREGIPNTMDLIGLYDVDLDDTGNILSYSRVDLRKRGDSQ